MGPQLTPRIGNQQALLGEWGFFFNCE